jgi:hypothetical protein
MILGYSFCLWNLYISFPRNKLSNGYLSFWVDNAQDTYQYSDTNPGVTFPIISATNDKQKFDKQLGYTQILATDPKENLVIFTEYTGR